MKNIKKENQTFESIKHIDENNMEFWYARELQKVLDYTEWRKFEGVVKKAIKACENSDISAFDHFVGIDKMAQIGSGAEKEVKDYKLTRYACYMVAQNGDPRKEVIADIGGTMPEDLPTPEKSLKQIEKENKKMLKK